MHEGATALDAVLVAAAVAARVPAGDDAAVRVDALVAVAFEDLSSEQPTAAAMPAPAIRTSTSRRVSSRPTCASSVSMFASCLSVRAFGYAVLSLRHRRVLRNYKRVAWEDGSATPQGAARGVPLGPAGGREGESNRAVRHGCLYPQPERRWITVLRANFVQFTRQGRLKLDHLISGRLELNQINEGFAALKSAAPVRQLIDFGA